MIENRYVGATQLFAGYILCVEQGRYYLVTSMIHVVLGRPIYLPE